MSTSTPNVSTFVRSLCWSMAGSDSACPYPQTINPKLQKISPPTLKSLALPAAPPAQRPPLSQRAHLTASPAALKSP
jgi:hypothetical protein